MPPPKFQPALLGGLFIGVLSALPIVSAGNLCCCLWVVGGGVIAAYVAQQNHPAPISAGDGLVVGFLAGILGAVVYAVAAVPVNMLTAPFQRELVQRFLAGAEDVPAEVRSLVENMSTGLAGVIIGFLFMLFSGVVFGSIGGLLGAVIFRRAEPQEPAAQSL